MDDGRTRARQFHDKLQRRRLEQRHQVKQEARLQGGNPDMHDNPDREDRLLFDSCDDVIREPDAIVGATELESRTMHEERRVHRDRDLEVVDDIERMDRQDFEVI